MEPLGALRPGYAACDLPSRMPRDFGRSTLRPRHRALVGAVADAMFPWEPAAAARDPRSARVRLAAFVDDVDSYVSHASRTLRFGLLLMLQVFRWAPLLLLWRFAHFESLAHADRVLVLERMEASRCVVFAIVLAAYRSIFCLLYYEQPAELAAIGYSGERRRWRRALPVVHADVASEAAE